MRYFIDDIPKIKLKYKSKDWIWIIIFLVVYFSPGILRVVHIKSKSVFLTIEILYYVSALLAAELVIYKERLKNFRCFKKRKDYYWVLIELSFICCFIIQLVLTFICRFFSTGVTENQASIARMPLMSQLILGIIYAPVVEEVLFRYVIRRMIRREGVYIIVSGIVFGMVHILSSIGNHSGIEIVAYAFPHIGVGLHLAYVYASTNSIETCIINHRLINLFAAIPDIIAWILIGSA